ncbi:CAP domain-containing protein [Puniceicoccales bacterium CK1056]|uniref:CAP domain-containing protein n=1 Tax=Oceanipulchritudo coccoides TaxID=2706888 RepID=A0A6B2M467_9BACT|nr:CAP domain-containing protein [Oceanipulchritudo coccoides]NDV63553.1 CAP domain-containing protein [Oceanipulchritudo coccoides]
MSVRPQFHLVLVCFALFLSGSRTDAVQSAYYQGDPTDWEQYLLELVNRARADPIAEASRYGLADLNEGLTEGAITSAPKQPLVLNPFLIVSSRAHSQWMVDNDTFSHLGQDNTSPTQRMIDFGYPLEGSWGTGENIAAFLGWKSGQRTSTINFHHEGLFLSADHRENILGPEFDEVGIGEAIGAYVLDGSEYPVSSLMTQNFGFSGGSPVPDSHFLTGVVYEDLDGNGFYTPGEGVGGIEIVPDSGSWFAVTSSSGGYAFPVGLGPKTLEVVFSGNGLVTTIKSVDLPGGTNVKLDFVIGVDDVVDPFSLAVPQTEDWYSLDWFGLFTQPESSWVYNSKSGFRFHSLSASGDLYFFNPYTGTWAWSSTSHPDILYQLGENAGWVGY